MHNRICSDLFKAVILNTSEHRSTIKSLAGSRAATRAAGHQPANSWRPATVITLLSQIPFFLHSIAASSLSDVGGDLLCLGAVSQAGS